MLCCRFRLVRDCVRSGEICIPLPPKVRQIYRAVADLQARYPDRLFTPDGHLVGSIGEVVAAEALGLTPYPPSKAIHDAYDANGNAQIKMTAGKTVSMYSCCERLVILRVVNPKRQSSCMTGRDHLLGIERGRCRRMDEGELA